MKPSEALVVENDVLVCPFCASEFVHHREVGVYTRREEDGPITRTNVEENGNLYVQQLGKDDKDPTERRNAIVIQFECELCEKKFQLEIRQNRGRTIALYNFDKRKKGKRS